MTDLSALGENKNKVKLTCISETGKDMKSTIKKLRKSYPNIYYTNVEILFFGKSLNNKDKKSIITLIMNDSELPLKCKAVILKDKTAQEQIKEIDSFAKSDKIYNSQTKIRFIEYAANTLKMQGRKD